MLFNSLDFAIFLPLVFFSYWFLSANKRKLQNYVIIASSLLFYGWWDWRFLGLILFSIIVDFFIGLALDKQEEKYKRKLLLFSSLAVNLGLLGFFKYFNFFVENFREAFAFFGTRMDAPSLNIILPVGISFYTFQTLSYTIDVYKRKIPSTTDFISFAAFVSFFPQLVAGPIERAKNLLPQFQLKRSFDYHKSVDGLRQILWGLFKKIVIADTCARYANLIFSNHEMYSGSTLLLGAVFFAFQIYGDFSGYSDVAIGTARLFGFNLMKNFAFPYFSRDIAEFWRRWHISLSTWFRDYLYIPLGGSKGPALMKIRNVFIIFIVSGFWHGANWTFIAWGALNAVFFLPLFIMKRNRKNLDVVAAEKNIPSLKDLFAMGYTFFITCIAWIFFRAENIHHAFDYIRGVFSASLFEFPSFPGIESAAITLFTVMLFMLAEWKGRRHEYGLERLGIKWKRPLRWTLYIVLIIITIHYSGEENEFIYFQF